MAILRRGVWLMVLVLAAAPAGRATRADESDALPRAVAFHELVVPECVSDSAGARSLFESLMDRELRTRFGVEVVLHPRLVVVGREKLFTDERRNLRAVRLALEPLLPTTPPVE